MEGLKKLLVAGIFLAFAGVIGRQIYRDFILDRSDRISRHDEGILARAEAGEAHAQYLMGGFRMQGRGGLPVDYAEARRWLEAAAAQDHAPARYRLGHLYLHGEGVPRDPAAAARLFRRAAEAGDVPSMNALGELYRDGEGVEEDLALARSHFEAAAKEGFAPAQRNLGVLAAMGRGEPEDFARARTFYEAAARQSDAIALKNLGLIHEHGQGVEADPLRAWDCYYRAALQGLHAAQERLDRVEALLPASWRSKGLYDREGVDCLEGTPRWISRPRSRVRP